MTKTRCAVSNRSFFLRSVRIPLRDIAVLLRGEDTREGIEIFRRRIAEMDAEIDQLTAVRRLLRYLQKKVSVSGSERWKESVPLLPRENSIPPMPSLPQDVRILSLPRLTVAAAHAIKMGDFHRMGGTGRLGGTKSRLGNPLG